MSQKYKKTQKQQISVKNYVKLKTPPGHLFAQTGCSFHWGALLKIVPLLSQIFQVSSFSIEIDIILVIFPAKFWWQFSKNLLCIILYSKQGSFIIPWIQSVWKVVKQLFVFISTQHNLWYCFPPIVCELFTLSTCISESYWPLTYWSMHLKHKKR